MTTRPSRNPVILLLFANDRGEPSGVYLRNLPEECRALQAALEPLSGQYEVIARSNITRDELFGLLRRYGHRTIGVHFGGHADPEALQIEAASGRQDALGMEGFAGRLGEMKALRWVFFNGCATRALVTAAQRRAPVTAIATVCAIRDDAAAEFAAEFYANLATGRTLAASFDAARDRLLSHPGSGVERFLRPAAQREDGPPWILLDPPGGPSSRDFRLAAPATGGFEPVPPRRALRAEGSMPSPTRLPSDRLALDRRKAGLQLAGHELTVELRRRGDEAEVRWHVGGSPVPIGPLAYAARLLDRPDPIELLDALFPPATEPPPLARILGRLGASTLPGAYSVRLRVCTAVAAWAALPWRRASTPRHPLVGGPQPWTIETTTVAAPTIAVTLARTPRIVVLESDAVTARGIRGALQVVSHRYASQAGRPDAVVGVPPDALGRALADDGIGGRPARRPFVVADAATPGLVEHLRRGLSLPADRPEAPAALCLVGAMPPPPLDLLAHAPVVVALPDLRAAKQWLRRVVVEDIDPVVAAHPITEPAHVGAHDPAVASRARAITPDAAPADAVMTVYARWHPARVTWDEPPPPRIMLDRVAQQDRVDKRVDELLNPACEHAAEVFVALAEPGHRVDLLGEQLVERIARRPTLHLEVRRPALPRLRAHGTRSLDPWLAAAVADVIDPGLDRDPAAIAAALARGHLPGTRRIVWLDWGTVGAADKLTGRELVAWLAWHIELARAAQAAGVRLAACLACETSDPARVRRLIEDEATERFSVAVQITPLDPLKTVTSTELQQYLRKREYSRVPPEYIPRLLSALTRAVPDGDFEKLVALLEEGLRIGWHDLWLRLSARGARPVDLDEEL